MELYQSFLFKSHFIVTWTLCRYKNYSTMIMNLLQILKKSSWRLNRLKRIEFLPYHFSMVKLVLVLVTIEMILACLLSFVNLMVFPRLVEWSSKAW